MFGLLRQWEILADGTTNRDEAARIGSARGEVRVQPRMDTKGHECFDRGWARMGEKHTEVLTPALRHGASETLNMKREHDRAAA